MPLKPCSGFNVKYHKFFFSKTRWSFIQGSRLIKGGEKYKAELLQGLGGKAFFQLIIEIYCPQCVASSKWKEKVENNKNLN